MLFLTMEFLSCETLAARIKRGPMSPAESLDLIDGLARAMRETTEATTLTNPVAIAGTVDYMAPEQI